MGEHAQDELKVVGGKQGERNGGRVVVAETEVGTRHIFTAHAGNGDTEENARRLVALWNACRGISTKRLETIASFKSDESRLSWLAYSADRVQRGNPLP